MHSRGQVQGDAAEAGAAVRASSCPHQCPASSCSARGRVHKLLLKRDLFLPSGDLKLERAEAARSRARPGRAQHGGRLAGKARLSRRLHLKNGLIVFPKQCSADGRIESVLQPSLSPSAVPGELLLCFGSRSELPAGNQFAGATGGGASPRHQLHRAPLSPSNPKKPQQGQARGPHLPLEGFPRDF